jgi:hypothetical protein
MKKNNSKKTIISFILIIISLFLLSCSSSNNRNFDSEYRTGSQGIVMNFVHNAPPSSVYDTDPLNILIEVLNKGAHDISRGSNSYIYLSGFDTNIITNIAHGGKIIEDLEGKSRYNPYGDKDFINFDGKIRDLSALKMDDYRFNLQATACYKYETNAQGLVCLDPEPFSSSSRTKVCSGSTSPSMGTQGAPIAVSNIIVEPTPGRTKFKISISNVGGGDVFKDGFNYLSLCSPYSGSGLQFEDMDMIKLSQVKVNNIDITGTCKPVRNGEVRLINGVANVICEVELSSGPAFTTPLTIQLNYGYRQTISKDLRVIATK